MKIKFLSFFFLAVLMACGDNRNSVADSVDNELPCDTMALRIALNSDPLFLEAMDPDNPFYTFMRDTDSLRFDQLNASFLRIYEEVAVNMEPCSPAYLEAFSGEPEVQHFAAILCEQMDLNQAIKDKYPCIMQLNETDRAAVLRL